MSTETSFETKFVLPSATSRRGRAGLLFHAPHWTEIHIYATEAETQIATRRLTGEYAVNAEQYAELVGDPGLWVTDRKPEPVKPPAPTVPPQAPSPAPLIAEMLADLGHAPPRTRNTATLMIEAALAAKIAELDTAPAAILRSIATAIRTGAITSATKRERHALAKLIPLRAQSGGAFGNGEDVLPAIGQRSWAQNETAPPAWLRAIADVLGEVYPPTIIGAHRAERDAIDNELAAAETAAFYAPGAMAEMDRVAVHNRSSEVSQVDSLKREARRLYELRIEELHQRAAAHGSRASEAYDLVHRRVVAAIDSAMVRAKDPLVRFALGELARHAREIPASRALDPDQLTALVLGRAELVRVEKDPLVPHVVALTVATRGGLKRRSRAGQIFTPMPRRIEVDESIARVIEADAALNVVRGQTQAEVEDMRSTALIEAEMEAIEAELAARKERRRKEALRSSRETSNPNDRTTSARKRLEQNDKETP